MELDGDFEVFKTAMKRQLQHCASENPDELWDLGDRKLSRKKWCLDTHRAMLRFAEEEGSFAGVYRRARAELQWYKSVGNEKGDVVYTGYYFPTLNASRVKTSEFPYPIYAKPDEVVQTIEDGKKVWRKRNPDGTFSKYFTRQQIDSEGALRGRSLELAWVSDPFSGFALHIEGAGAVLFKKADGTTDRVIMNYEAGNGQPYYSVGQAMRERGIDPSYYSTWPGMKRYFHEHPEETLPILAANASYPFFREDQEGPFGIGKVLLSPGHSIAIDPKAFPMGSVGVIRTQRPVVKNGEVVGWQSFLRLMVAQDTGGPIVGAGRVDVFWGDDTYAEAAAGNMVQSGELYFAFVP